MVLARAVVLLLLMALACDCQASSFTIYTTEFPRLTEQQGGQVAGMYVDLMRKVGEATGHQFSWVIQPWPRAQLSAQEDTTGLIINLTRNPSREGLFSWIGVVNWGRYGIFYLRDSRAGACVPRAPSVQVIGYLNGSDVLAVLQAEGFSKLEGAVTSSVNARKLQMARVAGWAVNVWTGPTVFEQAGFEVTALCVQPLGQAWDQWLAASPRFPAAVAAQIRASLVSLKADGTVKALEARYWRPVPGIGPPQASP